jgi:hypothetical protein
MTFNAQFFQILLVGVFCVSLSVGADTPVVGRDAQNKSPASAKKTGKEAAQEYFKADAERGEAPAVRRIQTGDHYLALHLGNYVQGDSWNWGQKEKQRNSGGSSAGVTYRFDEWGQSDLDIRIDFNEFKILDEKPLKMSFMPLIVFPEASSRFPLYFGAGAGLGIFFKQVADESNLSLDYQLFMGARFFNVYDTTGFFIETGLKNHLLITSDGQFNGTYLALGAVFTF